MAGQTSTTPSQLDVMSLGSWLLTSPATQSLCTHASSSSSPAPPCTWGKGKGGAGVGVDGEQVLACNWALRIQGAQRREWGLQAARGQLIVRVVGFRCLIAGKHGLCVWETEEAGALIQEGSQVPWEGSLAGRPLPSRAAAGVGGGPWDAIDRGRCAVLASGVALAPAILPGLPAWAGPGRLPQQRGMLKELLPDRLHGQTAP